MKNILLIITLFPSIINLHAQCWQSVDAGGQHALALKAGLKVWAWGDNHFGQVGNGTPYTISTWPVNTGAALWFTKISAGAKHSVGIASSGEVYCWGKNDMGELGIGNFSPYCTNPTPISTNHHFVSISAGTSHTVAITDSGKLWGWGFNNMGQLGNLQIGGAYPLQMGTDSNWQSVSAGYFHTLFIKQDGTLWATGDNTYGQIGNGNNIQVHNLLQIGTDTDWLMVSGGFTFSLALKTDSSLWAWGYNSSGQLGNGTQTDLNIPAQIGVSKNWKHISAGYNHSVAVKSDGTLWGWGENLFGQAGDTTIGIFLVPTKIGTDSDWETVSAGSEFTIAVKQSGILYTWGPNNLGQLGDSTQITQKKPHARYSPDCYPLSGGTINKNIENISIFPNPVSDLLTVILPQSSELATLHFKIFTVLGQCLQSGILQAKSDIHVADLAPGIYFIKINDVTEKFIKE